MKVLIIQIGDRVQCISSVLELNHKVGDIITVTRENIDYYEKWLEILYKKIENQ